MGGMGKRINLGLEGSGKQGAIFYWMHVAWKKRGMGFQGFDKPSLDNISSVISTTYGLSKSYTVGDSYYVTSARNDLSFQLVSQF